MTPLPEPIQPFLPWLDIAGVAVFAASGALAAARARQTIVTACFFALVTGVGGGTVRDLLIGAPVFWVHDPLPAAVCLGVAGAIWLSPPRIWSERALDWFDAIGLAAYTVFGAAKALDAGIPPFAAALMGVVTACMGGIIRDVVAGVPSIILRPELYVTAAALASGSFVGATLLGVPAPLPALIGAGALSEARAQNPIGAGSPPSMTRPGAGFSGYGVPAEWAQGIKRLTPAPSATVRRRCWPHGRRCCVARRSVARLRVRWL